jgi:hypothetical protein
VCRQAGYEDDGNAIDIGAEQNAAGEGEAGLRVETAMAA